MTSKQAQDVIPMRIVVHDPIPGVDLCVQSGRADLMRPSSVSDTAVVFDLFVRVGLPNGEGAVGFFGPFTQGPPRQRFVYVNVGRRAGQASAWDRRAKVPLTDISPEQIRRVLAVPGSVLTVGIPSRGRDGGPICASVKLPAGAWRIELPTNA